MRVSWTKRYPPLGTHDWEETPYKNDTTKKIAKLTCFTCKTCKYVVWINSLGFAQDHRGMRGRSPNDPRLELYSFYTCNDFVVKNIIE